jgi:hypothetical protein
MYSRASRYFPWIALVGILLVLAAIWIPGLGMLSASPGYAQVLGHVSYNGKPVTGCAIIFMPPDRFNSNWGSATLGPDGRFAVVHKQSDAALSPGRYDVFFVVNRQPLAPKPSDDRLSGEAPERTGQTVASEPVKPSIPERYTKLETSGLWVDIGREQNRIEINLKD